MPLHVHFRMVPAAFGYNAAVKTFVAIIALLICSASTFAEPRHSAILLLPVTVINGAGSEWVGQSVQQSLQTDLHNASIAHTAALAMDDSDAIARIARNASADFVVGGQVQIAADQVRLTATVFNHAGASIGAAKATGDMRHLFDLEDALADQIRNDIDRSAAAQQPITTPIPVIQSSGPIRIAAPKALPIGTVAVSYTSTALRDGRDRYIYQLPFYGCFGGYGYGYCGLGCYGCGGFCCGFGGVFNGSYSTGGTHSLPW